MGSVYQYLLLRCSICSLRGKTSLRWGCKQPQSRGDTACTGDEAPYHNNANRRENKRKPRRRCALLVESQFPRAAPFVLPSVQIRSWAYCLVRRIILRTLRILFMRSIFYRFPEYNYSSGFWLFLSPSRPLGLRCMRCSVPPGVQTFPVFSGIDVPPMGETQPRRRCITRRALPTPTVDCR